MLFPATFVLFAVAAAVDEELKCRTQALTKCDNDPITEIPDTIEDFKRVCKTVQDVTKCQIEENEKCIAYDAVELRKFFRFLETNCDEDSSLYQALSRNYECMKTVAKNIDVRVQCDPSQEELDELVDNLKPILEELSPSAQNCSYPQYTITCYAHIFGMHCGQESKETVAEILRNTYEDFQICNEESIVRELQSLEEMFESSFNITLEVENVTVKSTAAIDERWECYNQALVKCHYVERHPKEIPDTMEDFKRDCQIEQDLLNCIIEESDKCTVNALDPADIIKYVQFLETNCDEDSSLYQALSRNYECIQPIAKNLGNECRPSDEDWRVLVDNLKPKVGELSESIRHCPYHLYEPTCIAHIIGMHCGQESKETVTEIFRNLDSDLQNCIEESILGELQPLKELFDSLFNGTLVVEDVIVKEFEEGLVESLNTSYYLTLK